MSNLEIFALVCLLAGLVGEGLAFRRVLQQIKQFRGSIPPEAQVAIQTVKLSSQELTATSAEALAEKYTTEMVNSTNGDLTLTLIRQETAEGQAPHPIILAINRYLMKARGAVIDFVLIKNMVDRHVQMNRQTIRWQAWGPLLIGLAVLFVGTSISLFFLPDLPDELISRPVVAGTTALFLSAAKLIAIVFPVGLLLSLLTVGWLYPSARLAVLRRQNNLYTLVQAELLPVLFQDTTHSLNLLQTSLNSFQRDFMGSITELQGLMNKNYETLKAQEKIAESLQKIDIMQLAKANVDIFQALGKSAESLEQFQSYLSQMNQFVANTADLNEKVNHFLYRTQHLETIAEKIKETLDQNERLHHFIKSHFSELEDRGQLITHTVVKIDDVLDKSLNELMEHTQHKIRAIRDLSAQEENQLLKTYEENKHVFGKLAKIEDLHNNFADYKAQNLAQQQEMLEQLKILNERLTNGKPGFFKKLLGS